MAKDFTVNLKNPEDSPQKIAEKLNTLSFAIDATVIRGAVPREEFDTLSKNTKKYIEGQKERLNMNDQRWHGAGLSQVIHDTTLTGLGNVTSPLSVAGGAGTVTSVSVVTANGVSGSVATATTTPAITLTLGAITPTSTNGVSSTTMAFMDATSSVQTQLNAKGSGTVTAVSIATANGVSGSSSGGATPALTIALGAITPTTVNGNTFTTGSSTYTGTAAQTYTFPTTSATIARTDAANTFTGTQTIGALVATTINGNTITTGSSTFTGTAAQTYTFPTTTATIARTDAAQTFTGTQTFSQVNKTANAITASGNAATVPITSGHNIVTNNSAATLTITLTTTSAVNMQTCVVQILDFSAVAQTITWVNTENSMSAAPVTSNGSTTLPLTIGFMYNSATSKWRCISAS